MAATFSTMKVALDEIATKIQHNRQRLTQCVSLAAAADADLGGMTAQYSAIVTDINAQLAATPNDEAVKTLKAEKDLLVAEFNALKTAAANMKTATQGVTF